METIKVNFKDCGRIELDKWFGIEQTDSQPVLNEWLSLSLKFEIKPTENEILNVLQEILLYRVDDWNEKELIEHFIGPLFGLINFNTRTYGFFSDRSLKATIGQYELSGNPDGVIAKGRRAPEMPYFCFHEYKKENDSKGDPAGQCLAAMLVAQELNKNERPIYGVYVVGRNWFFMVLKDKAYSITKAYQAVDEDIFEIVRILKHLKVIIDEFVKMDTK